MKINFNFYYYFFKKLFFVENDEIDPNELKTDGRYNHPLQIQERLNFLRFLLKDGQLWLCADQVSNL